VAPLEARAQTGEYGDAPEGVLAYPATGMMGQFPTCRLTGPAGFVYHAFSAPNAWFGPMVDMEPDGNAGICPPPPYDQDECSPLTDNDAGLIIPDAYTIVGGLVTTCGQPPSPRALGLVCTQAVWGANVDILVNNMTPTVVYANVLMDWNQNGAWAGSSVCPMGNAPERVLTNLPVPPGFVGPLSALGPPGFLIGPNAGYVWTRFTIGPTQLGPTWPGAGNFTLGESEDYLLRVDEELYGDFGDAPEGAMAYPTLGIQGQFPTCINVLPSGFVVHQPGSMLWFGPTLDFEMDGNAGTCLFPPYDQDECSPGTDNDAGLVMPDAYTIVGGIETLCAQVPAPRALGTTCTPANWGANVDIIVQNLSAADAYVNVVMDWDQSGTWGGSAQCPMVLTPEWVLQNFIVPAGFAGPLSALGPPGFLIGPNMGYVWSRFTLTPTQILAASWDGSGSFSSGESEDYLLRVNEEMLEGDFGDAPEGAIAYPGPGTIGQFPTCINVGPAGYVFHPFPTSLWFGQMVDPELDGNAGICPPPPYDQDECSQATDIDAGLMIPDAYTISAGLVALCGQVTNPRALGTTCATANWGANVDIMVNNNSTLDAYVNVLMDWDQSGAWGGSSQCPIGPAPEWVLVNQVVPAGYIGPLSGLVPPAFLIGPTPGYVWTRFTITPQMVVASDWDGSGTFTQGESEDYLLRVDEPVLEGDFGDAPEGAIAYPSPGTPGQFPTCLNVGPAGSYVFHLFPTPAWFGPTVDPEMDGNAGVCPQPPYDQDECSPGTDADAGLLMPDAYTIVGAAVTLCSPNPTPRPLGMICTTAVWGVNVDILVNNNSPMDLFVNVLMDWDQSGSWGGASQCPLGPAPEWVLVNFPVPGGFIGPLSALAPPSFQIGPRSSYLWSRFTITNVPIIQTNWDGSGVFDIGESEDYLLRVDEMILEGDFGDAPEGAVAYPGTGTIGQFPTCTNVIPAGFVFHSFPTSFWFGPTVDPEMDGNAGICPPPPYDQDECSPGTDIDAGLLAPDPYTIVGGVAALCAQVPSPRALGSVCTQAVWGPNVDIQVTNNSPAELFVNVLMDWDQGGSWGGGSQCPLGGPAPEWVLTNFQVPPGYIGPLSALGPPGFLIGPQPGLVWSRFTITNVPIMLADWDGSGAFDTGESEDYLLRVNQVQHGEDFGDAPEGVLAYPSTGMTGQFPTCINILPAGFVSHALPTQVWFGPTVDGEPDGNAGVCPPPPYDRDECSQGTDLDAGLLMPDPYTIVGGVVTLCSQISIPRSLGGACVPVNWGQTIDILVNNNTQAEVFVNVLMDWDQSGTWGGASICLPGVTPEWVLVNFPVPPGFIGPLSALGPPGFQSGPRGDYVWSRFTITTQPVLAAKWDGSGSFNDGESEDYLILVDSPTSGANDVDVSGIGKLVVEAAQPNPFNPMTTIAWAMPSAVPVRVTVHDSSGRVVRRLVDTALNAGHHTVVWDGGDDTGRPVGSGMYFVKVVAGNEARTTKVMLAR
jgi:hypothetical protein